MITNAALTSVFKWKKKSLQCSFFAILRIIANHFSPLKIALGVKDERSFGKWVGKTIGKTVTILETKRLFLRRFIPADMNELYDLVYADEVVKSTWSGVTGTADEIKESFVKRNVEPDGSFGFRAIVAKMTANYWD